MWQRLSTTSMMSPPPSAPRIYRAEAAQRAAIGMTTTEAHPGATWHEAWHLEAGRAEPITLEQPSARLSFCWRPLRVHVETPTKGRGGCSRMTVSPTATLDPNGCLEEVVCQDLQGGRG